MVRVHLTNRFGLAPVTFDHVTIGRQAAGAALIGPPATVTFGGKRSVTAAPGHDVVSDPVAFSYQAFQNLAVSVYVSKNAGMPTEHYEGRQTSYFTPDAAGDHTANTEGAAFSLYNSTRPFVNGLDVVAPASTGAVVAFGDSITDGYQGQAPAGIPASPEGYNENRRWPDDLARLLIAARINLSVLNAGISGNRVLLDGAVGGNPDTYGRQRTFTPEAGRPRASGNDHGDLARGDKRHRAVAHGHGCPDRNRLREGHRADARRRPESAAGTLTPSGGDATSSYGGTAANQEREDVNAWIRANSPADGVIDFDTAVRDPSDPSRINPDFDGGDHLHLNPAGYQAMANAVDLALLRRADCTLPALQLTASPRRVEARKRVILHFHVTARQGRHANPVNDAVIAIGGDRLHVNHLGRASITVCFPRSGRIRVRVTAIGYLPSTATITAISKPAVSDARGSTGKGHDSDGRADGD